MYKHRLLKYLTILLFLSITVPKNVFAQDANEEVSEVESSEKVSSNMDEESSSEDIPIPAVEETESVEVESLLEEEDIEENIDSGLVDTEEESITQFNDDLTGFELVADNDQFELHVDPTSLAVKIRNKGNDYIWSSTIDDMENERLNTTWQNFIASAVTIETLNSSNQQNTENILTEGTTIDYQTLANGFQATIVFPSELSLQIVVELTEQGITVRVPASQIIETEEARLLQVTVYPFLGATKADTVPGYIFVPDGSGALINFQNDNLMRSPYVARIYGPDLGIQIVNQNEDIKPLERVRIPVYGAVHGHEQNAFVAIVKSGDTYGEIEASVAGLATDFNNVTANFLYRHSYQQPTNSSGSQNVNLYTNQPNQFNIEVDYHFLADEDASYVGMALDYQAHLVEEGVLTQLEETSPMMQLEFLGGETQEGLISDTYIPMTTISQMEEVLNTYLDANMNQLLVLYRGWSSGGFSANLPNKFPFDNRLGSAEQLQNLQERLTEDNIPLYLYADYSSANTVPANVSANNYAQHVNSQDIEILQNDAEMNLMLPNTAYTLAMRNVLEFQQLGVQHLALDQIGSRLYSTHNSDYNYTREVTKRINQALVADMSTAIEESVSLYDANAYLWQWANILYDVPMNHSNYTYFSDVVPFLQIVLKGYMNYYAPYANFSADQQQNLLTNIEYGALPSFILTYEDSLRLVETPSRDLYSTQHEGRFDMIQTYYEAYGPYYEVVNNASITSRQIIANNIVEVGYSNGVNIVLNYSSEDYQYNEVVVPASDFIIMEGVE